MRQSARFHADAGFWSGVRVPVDPGPARHEAAMVIKLGRSVFARLPWYHPSAPGTGRAGNSGLYFIRGVVQPGNGISIITHVQVMWTSLMSHVAHPVRLASVIQR